MNSSELVKANCKAQHEVCARRNRLIKGIYLGNVVEKVIDCQVQGTYLVQSLRNLRFPQGIGRIGNAP